MDITGEFAFDLPQEIVWDVLRDPKALASIIPMIVNVQQIADNQYTGSLFFRVGSVAGTFQGKIELLNIQAPNSYEIKVQGSSYVGQATINGRMRLESQDNRTTMFYDGNVNFGGRIASVGSRLLEVSTRSIIQQSFETLSRYLTVKFKKS
jgi:uncharacterized protein